MRTTAAPDGLDGPVIFVEAAAKLGRAAATSAAPWDCSSLYELVHEIDFIEPSLSLLAISRLQRANGCEHATAKPTP